MNTEHEYVRIRRLETMVYADEAGNVFLAADNIELIPPAPELASEIIETDDYMSQECGPGWSLGFDDELLRLLNEGGRDS